MAKDLRGFLNEIEADEPDQVLHVTREVDPHFEVTGVLARLEKERKFPIVIFEKVKGSKLPVVTNVHAEARRLFRAIGLKDGTLPEFIREYSAREDSPKPPVIVKEAPVHEVVLTGKDVNVTRLPILTYHEKDAGRYITAGFGIMRDPDSGVRNAGIYRLMVHSPDSFGIQLSETAHGHYIWQMYERQNRPTPMAVAIGHHPAFYIGCLSFTSLETDEFSIAGGIMGEPVRLVPCQTIDLEVPADAEIVLECEILPKERKSEAPFGEYPGTYGPQRNNPIVQVKAITMRRNAF
ncbi:MAG: UbiD family decarboxylase, partial [Deltaproteobacteria bacterium]